ncbi:hypothetical protein [Streptomyces roseolus]|uniref:hypothetical protein n=1 Tax=Streptomyces roseolus TaxID=67358 RepID=UPI001673FC57|nr:hypothetical protein [Streptomyces roseolus]GGR18585.1 hypothetical protein GCM10010282_08460 [Streptomyces roseolus]
MGVRTVGPAWAEEGPGHGSPASPLSVEGPVRRPADRLAPGVSGVTEHARHSTLHAADAERRSPGTEECRAPLAAHARRAFPGDRRQFPDPRGTAGPPREYGSRPARDPASRLVDDVPARSRRVALRENRHDPRTGRHRVLPRPHARHDRSSRPGEEPSAETGVRVHRLARQPGLFAADDTRGGAPAPTDHARTSLDGMP